MRSVEMQTVHTQTPAVERSYQTRHADVDHQQRAAGTVQKDEDQQKMQETQESQDAENAKIQIEKEKEREARDQRKKKAKAQEAEPDEENQVSRNPVQNGRIDIRI